MRRQRIYYRQTLRYFRNRRGKGLYSGSNDLFYGKFDEILKNIRKDCPKIVEIFKTICYTTIKRQEEAESISAECDAVIVLGGKKAIIPISYTIFALRIARMFSEFLRPWNWTIKK